MEIKIDIRPLVKQVVLDNIEQLTDALLNNIDEKAILKQNIQSKYYETLNMFDVYISSKDIIEKIEKNPPKAGDYIRTSTPYMACKLMDVLSTLGYVIGGYATARDSNGYEVFVKDVPKKENTSLIKPIDVDTFEYNGNKYIITTIDKYGDITVKKIHCN